MAKLVLLWCLWLASTTQTIASSPPAFEALVDRSINHGNEEYLYESPNVMEGSAISNIIQSFECRRGRRRRAATNGLTHADPPQYLSDRHSTADWAMDCRH